MYGHDLAFIHHTGFGAFSREAAPWIVQQLHDADIRDGVVIDLACGSGILARELVAAGYDVLGIDVSSEMIGIARATAPSARFVVASLFEVPLPPCRAVFCVGEGLSYLGPGQERVELHALFLKIAKALESGGLFIFDVIEPSPSSPMDYHAVRRDLGWEVFIEVSENPSDRIITRRIETLRDVHGTTHRSVEEHRVQTFDADEIAGLLKGARFETTLTRTYGATRLLDRRIGAVARKPHLTEPVKLAGR